jgi:capsular exopolysaccharide synthesis family protein
VQPRYILGLIRKWFWLLVLAALIGGAAGFIVNRLQPKQYQAVATVFITSPNHIDYSSLLGAQQAARAFAAIPLYPSILESAIKTTGDTSISETQLALMVTVQNDLNSQFVAIQVRDKDPNRAARLASAIARQSVNQFQETITGGNSTKFLQNEIASLQGQIKSQEQALAHLQSQPSSPDQVTLINQASANLGALRQQYSQDVNAYDGLISIQVTLIQDAQVPDKPVGLGGPVAIAIGILVGLIAIVGVIILIEQTDDVLRTPAKVAKATGLPTFITLKHLPGIAKQVPWVNAYRPGAGVTVTVKPIAALTHRASSLDNNNGISEDTAKRLAVMTKAASATPSTPLLNGTKSRFKLPESFLTLGVLLSSDNPQQEVTEGYQKSLIITSPENGDGKTIIASQIALGLARIGVKVVLIDTNLRNPSIHKIFGVSNRIGLSTILSTERIKIATGELVDTTEGALQETSEANLMILPGGPPVETSPTLLSSSRMTDIINQLSQHAFVVIDSAAVLTTSEAIILANKCDSILLVVNARHTTATKLNQSVEMLSRIHVPIEGIVLNQSGK